MGVQGYIHNPNTYLADTYLNQGRSNGIQPFYLCTNPQFVRPSVAASLYILSIRDMLVKPWYRRFGCETIHPTQKLPSFNLLQPLRLWRLSDAKDILSLCTLWHFNFAVHPTAPVLLTKDSRNEISYDFQPPFSLHILSLRTKPAGLDF